MLLQLLYEHFFIFIQQYDVKPCLVSFDVKEIYVLYITEFLFIKYSKINTFFFIDKIEICSFHSLLSSAQMTFISMFTSTIGGSTIAHLFPALLCPRFEIL